MFTIKRKKDNRVIHAWSAKLADIPGGIAVSAADITSGVLHEGQPIGVDSNGLGHVVKTATLNASANNSATTYTVKKGHDLAVGDYIMGRTGGKAYAIASIATNATDSTCDDITVGTTLGVALTKGATLVQAAAESTGTSSAFKYTPIAMVGEAYDVLNNENLIVNAITMGQIIVAKMEITVSDDIKKALTNINFI